MLRTTTFILALSAFPATLSAATPLAWAERSEQNGCGLECSPYLPQSLPEPEVPQPGADVLTGAPVYDMSDDHVGRVARLDYDPLGQILNATVAMGADGAGRSITLTAEHLTIMQGIEDPGMQVYIDLSMSDILMLSTPD